MSTGSQRHEMKKDESSVDKNAQSRVGGRVKELLETHLDAREALEPWSVPELSSLLVACLFLSLARPSCSPRRRARCQQPFLLPICYFNCTVLIPRRRPRSM